MQIHLLSDTNMPLPQFLPGFPSLLLTLPRHRYNLTEQFAQIDLDKIARPEILEAGRIVGTIIASSVNRWSVFVENCNYANYRNIILE
jgi:hypothetical protein